MKIKPPCTCLIAHVDAFTDRIEKRDPACPAHGDARLAELDRPEIHQALADRLLELRVLIDDIRKFKVSSYSTSPVGTSFAISPGVDDVSLVERVERAAQDEELFA